MQYHYNTFHLKTRETSSESIQPSIAQSFGQVEHFSAGSSRHQLLQKDLAKCLIENMLPFFLVSSSSFLKFVGHLDTRFKVGAAITYPNTIIPKEYDDIGLKEDKMLKPVEAVECTTDAWTSVATESYTILTCHFIDTEWKMQSICLQTRHCPESHTAEYVKEILKEAFQEWKLNDKVITGVIDNAKNMVNA